MSLSEDSTALFILSRLRNSVHAGRLWTAQEVGLPPRVFALGNASFYDMDALRDSFERTASWLQKQIFAHFPSPVLNEALPILENCNTELVLHAIRNRVTSRQNDEAICLATLLRLDVSEILQTDADMRMVALYKQMQWIPDSVVFAIAEHLDYPGFRWAPRSLLTSSGTQLFERGSGDRDTGARFMSRVDSGGRGLWIYTVAIRLGKVAIDNIGNFVVTFDGREWVFFFLDILKSKTVETPRHFKTTYGDGINWPLVDLPAVLQSLLLKLDRSAV
ncbi:hypothetical protein M8818_005064 [Zalaria obscura]|uniref:Uncharacterized protein n=1 Tax=Zalaria obscura TaxID=2024903 RepID=A0ACC3SA05_9PEZI